MPRKEQLKGKREKMATNNPTPTEAVDSIRNAVEFGSEVLVPGGSNLIKGDLKTGGAYAIAGFVARAAFGLPGLLVVSASSITKAMTGRHLYEQLGLAWPKWKQGDSSDNAKAN
jgi:hypothetical protein